MTGPDTPLPPIIKRASSPTRQAVSSEALVSPRFHDPPSPNPLSHPHAQPQPGSYFSSQAGTPSPSGILLNKNERGAQRDPASRDRDGGGGRISPAVAVSPPGSNAGEAAQGLLRVSSPDGSASESGVSDAAGPSSTAPSSLVGSPPSHSLAKPGLPGLAIPSSTPTNDDSAGAATRRASSPPSPHCHFAPLPKVDNDRPGTRRNSFANRVKPFVPKADRPDGLLLPGSAFDHDDDGDLPSPPGAWQAGDSSIPTPSALSQRLNSSLTFANPPPNSTGSAGGISPVRPGSRRSSSSRRSRSPSPPGGVRYRTPSASGQSRSHSPNLSRHASTDALSLHYIEAGAEGRGAALSRTSSRAGSERGGPAGEGEGEGGVSFASSGQPVRRLTSTDRTSSSSKTRVAPFIDRDKEADMHRLQEKAAQGNVDAERAVSPALAAARERSASRGAAGEEREREGRPMVIKRKGSNEEVVEVGPGEEKDAGDLGGELEEVEEEPEEEEAEENGSDEDEGTDEDEGENERDREGEEDEDEDDEDEETEMEERKTSKGAAVEVVRWHRPERDVEREAQPSPANVPHASSPTAAVSPPAPPIPTPAVQ